MDNVSFNSHARRTGPDWSRNTDGTNRRYETDDHHGDPAPIISDPETGPPESCRRREEYPPESIQARRTEHSTSSRMCARRARIGRGAYAGHVPAIQYTPAQRCWPYRLDCSIQNVFELGLHRLPHSFL